MSYSPTLLAHIWAGIIALPAGTAAMVFRKGSPRHVLAGRVFVASMLTMSAAATYLAILNHETPNILAGTLTLYLITTAWLTARRKDGQTSKLDWLALLIPLTTGAWVSAIGLEKVFSNAPPKDGVPLGMNFFVGSVMLLSAAGDIRMVVRGGLFGAKRVARHLWRMCFGLFIAAGSFFLGGANRPLRLLSSVGIGQHLPRALFSAGLYLVLTLLPLILLIFWLVRVRFTKAYNGKAMIPGRPARFVEQRPAP